MPTSSYPVVILGAGLTGLSTAYHLEDVPSVVLERENEAGGLCRTHVEEGFTFDCTGHLLHLRDASVSALVRRLLPGGLARHERRAQIYSNGVLTPYPFQANLHGLPIEVVKECILGFMEAQLQREREGDRDPAGMSFREWCLATFGQGIAKHFMIPYNSKLWRTDLNEIECGWVSWSIPRPSLREILDGAFGSTVKGLGYNPTFLYPRRRGISVLPEALAERCPEIRLNETVEKVDAGARTVRLASGATIGYERLVSTIPLDRLLSITSGLPSDLPAVARRLRAVRVLNISLGIDRASVSKAHWIYFPASDVSFYRVGFPSNLSVHLAPRGCSSLYVERSLHRDEPFRPDDAIDAAVEDLRRLRVLRSGDRVVYSRLSVLDPAYVIYDRFRASRVPVVLESLERLGIHSAGRFGFWEYSSMESAIRAGMNLAARIAPLFAARRRRGA